MRHSKKHTRLAILASGIFILSASSACSIFSPEETTMSDSEACDKLNELIADHSQNFNHFKRSLKNSGAIRNMQIWNAEHVFPLAKNCQVWEWSTGLTNYFCSWQESDNMQAKENHDKGVAIVRQCLDKQWQSDYIDTQSGGGRTLFYQEGGKTFISIRFFRESRTILENWKTTLYVGDESNLNAAVQ